MTNIYWKYVGTFIIGLLFLISFSKVIFGFQELNHRDEKFLFVYKDCEISENLTKQSSIYEIDCESWQPTNRTLLAEDSNQNMQNAAGLVIVNEADSLSYQKIMNYFKDNDGEIDIGLIKWLLQIFMTVFLVGIVLILLRTSEKRGGKRCRIIYFSILILIWLLYKKSISGFSPFPVWVLPGKWSDFAGWKELGDSVGRQLFSMMLYKGIPAVGECYTAVYGVIAYLIISFFLLYLYNRCCAGLHQEGVLHLTLSIVALGFYLLCSNPDMKALIYFFPCFAFSRKAMVLFKRDKAVNEEQ